MSEVFQKLNALGVPDRYRNGTGMMDKQHNAAGYTAVRSWLTELRSEPFFIYLWGGVGQGKSAWLWLATAALIKHGHSVHRTTVGNFVMDYTHLPIYDRREFVDKHINYHWLIVDEWGAETVKDSDHDAAMAAFFRVLDTRYEHSKKVLGAGNMSPNDLAKKSEYWERILSRVNERGGAVHMKDGDMRQRTIGADHAKK